VTSFNTILKVYSYTWSNQLYMYGLEVIPSKADYGFTSGVFGNSNGNATDDIVFRPNTNIASDSFLEQFKLALKSKFKNVYDKKYLTPFIYKLPKSIEQHTKF